MEEERSTEALESYRNTTRHHNAEDLDLYLTKGLENKFVLAVYDHQSQL